jgi:hypothetical protein
MDRKCYQVSMPEQYPVQKIHIDNLVKRWNPICTISITQVHYLQILLIPIYLQHGTELDVYCES